MILKIGISCQLVTGHLNNRGRGISTNEADNSRFMLFSKDALTINVLTALQNTIEARFILVN